MKKFFTLTIIAFSMSLTAFAQTKEMTVKDYYLAILTEFIKLPPAKGTAWIEQNEPTIGYLGFSILVK